MLRRELIDLSRAMAKTVQAAFSVADARDFCAHRQFDILLLVGDARHLAATKEITDLGGWAAAMPIVAVCNGSLNLAEARAAGVSVVIPKEVDQSAIFGAIAGAMATDSRAATWWLD
ncbi:MAG: hypothetical protein WDM79_02800 [Terricaulis sp.]